MSSKKIKGQKIGFFAPPTNENPSQQQAPPSFFGQNSDPQESQNPLNMFAGGWGNVQNTMNQVQSMIGTVQQLGPMISPMLSLLRGANSQEQITATQSVVKTTLMKRKKKKTL